MKALKRSLQICGVFLFFAVPSILGLTVYYPVDTTLAQWQAPELPQDLEAYLRDSEARIQPKPGTEKTILWADAEKKQTPLAFVYLHGFSATRREISPVIEDVAKHFHANVFFTRLEGHGLGVSEFNNATAAQWIRDANEALAIGKRLGQRVVLIGTSTGVPLALHLAIKKDPALAGLVSISANFRPYRPESLLSSGAAGLFITRMILGDAGYSWKPKNPEHQYYWTTTFPPGAVHQLMELLKYAGSLDIASLQLPSSWIYTENDRVVSPSLIVEKFQEIGGKQKQLINTKAANHVLAGAITSPEEIQKVETMLQEFIQQL